MLGYNYADTRASKNHWFDRGETTRREWQNNSVDAWFGVYQSVSRYEQHEDCDGWQKCSCWKLENIYVLKTSKHSKIRTKQDKIKG